ncbi:MAG: transposase [Candidatus Brocadiia bacterium]
MRCDTDADFGKKTDRGRREDGTLWETVKMWFGYKLHLVVDAEYELPVAYEVTAASRPDNESLKRMVDDMADTHPELLKEAEALAAGRATATPRSSRSSGTATG